MSSFLERHRTICSVLYEIKEMAEAGNTAVIPALCDEAILYARRMSMKLMEYKKKEEQGDVQDQTG